MCCFGKGSITTGRMGRGPPATGFGTLGRPLNATRVAEGECDDAATERDEKLEVGSWLLSSGNIQSAVRKLLLIGIGRRGGQH